MERVHSNNIHIIYVRDNRRGQPRMENRETQSALGSRHNTQPRMENRETVSLGLKSQYATQNGKSRDTVSIGLKTQYEDNKKQNNTHT